MNDVLIIGGGVIPEGDIPKLGKKQVLQKYLLLHEQLNVIEFIKAHVKEA